MSEKAWNGKWCTYCRVDSHSDAECSCTRPADWHPGRFIHVESGWLHTSAAKDRVLSLGFGLVDPVLDALRELVELKDMHDRIENRGNGLSNEEAKVLGREYRERRPAAWRRARNLLALETHAIAESEPTWRQRAMRMREGLYEVLGAQHVLKGSLGFIAKWHADPNFKLEPELERVRRFIGEWHRRLVEAVHPGWNALMEPRDYCGVSFTHEPHERCDGSPCPKHPEWEIYQRTFAHPDKTGGFFICIADGEGSHEARICSDEEAVFAFYEQMCGKDQDGTIDSLKTAWRDADEWRNDRTALRLELYCATFSVWQVSRNEVSMIFADRPRLALEWAQRTFGDTAVDPKERCMRFVEEAVELANTIGVLPSTVVAIVERVYANAKGDRALEVGQAQFTLELLAEVFAIDPQRMAAAEWERVQTIPQEEWSRRHKAKADLGIALASTAA